MRELQRLLALPLASAAAVVLAGCLSIHDPTTNPTTTTPTTVVSDPTPAPERGGRIPAAANAQQTRLAPGAASSEPVAALERYAKLWSNWTAGTVAADQRRLASISLGQARAQALQATATLARDSTLTRSDVANTGQVIAITPALHAPGVWVVAISERTTGAGQYAGLPATVHVNYAQLTHTHHGYVVERWSAIG